MINYIDIPKYRLSIRLFSYVLTRILDLRVVSSKFCEHPYSSLEDQSDNTDNQNLLETIYTIMFHQEQPHIIEVNLSRIDQS